MTCHDVRVALDAISDLRMPNDNWSDAQAHQLEDALYEKVLKSIADGTCEDPKHCAYLALQTKQMEFDRWFD